MKAAAAVLGASLLFFLGVVTGAGRRESVPPPAAIPLRVANPAVPAAESPSPSEPSGGPGATSPTPGARPSGSSSPSAGTAPPTPATASPTAPPGRVEQVDNQVDCVPAGKKGKGQREPCPSTTTLTGDGPGGGAKH